MYNGVVPLVLGTGVVGGSLATTGFDTLLWAGGAAALLVIGLVLIRLSTMTRAKGN